MVNRNVLFTQWICLGLLSAIIIGCSNPEPIKIGMVAAISGRRSQLGVSARNAVIQAFQEINDKGGINGQLVELVVTDNKDDIEECKKAVAELIENDVVAIIGPLMSKMIATTLAAVQNKNILVISPTVSTTDLENQDDLFLRLMPVASREAGIMADVALKQGARKFAVVYDVSNKAYTVPIFKTFSERVRHSSGAIVYSNDMLNRGAGQFTRLADGIINSGAQAVYIVSSGIDAAFLCQQIRKQNQTIQFLGSQWVKSGNIIEHGGKSVEGMLLSTTFEREQKSSNFLSFEKKHLQMFKTPPNFVAIYSYETAQVLAQGMAAARELTALEIKKAILTQKEFDGLEERFIINEFGDAIRSNAVLVIENGTFKRRSK